MLQIYQERISPRCENRHHEDAQAQTTTLLRTGVDQVPLSPENGKLEIILRGAFGAVLRFAAGKKNPDFLTEAEALDNLLSQGSLVAGGRNTRSLLSWAFS